MFSKLAISVFALLMALIAIASFASAQNTNWDGSGPSNLGTDSFVAIALSSGSGNAKPCYANAGSTASNYYFELANSGTAVKIYQCTDNACASGCVEKQMFEHSTEGAGSYNKSYMFGDRKWNLGSTVYSANSGTEQKKTFSATGCTDNKKVSEIWYPQSSSTCVPTYGKTESVKRYCSGSSVPMEQVFSNNDCSGTAENNTYSTSCDNVNKLNWVCDSTTGYKVVVFDNLEAASAGKIASFFVAVMMVVMSVLI